MKTISSKSGTRLAKAVAAFRAHKVGDPLNPSPGTQEIMTELSCAAIEVGDELIADNHHLCEGDRL